MKYLLTAILHVLKDWSKQPDAIEEITNTKPFLSGWLLIVILGGSMFMNAFLFYRFAEETMKYYDCLNTAGKQTSFYQGSTHWIAEVSHFKQGIQICRQTQT